MPYEKTINEFLVEAASASPTPGGGNISAVVSSLGASMISMVGNLTINKKGYEQYHSQAQEIVDTVMKDIEELKELTRKDMAAFNDYMKCFRMANNTAEEKEARNQAIQTAAKKATIVPLSICRVCLYLLEQAEVLSHFGNKMAISDVGVGAYICEASLRACMLSVDINIPTIKDDEFVNQVLKERAWLFQKAEALKNRAISKVTERMG